MFRLSGEVVEGSGLGVRQPGGKIGGGDAHGRSVAVGLGVTDLDQAVMAAHFDAGTVGVAAVGFDPGGVGGAAHRVNSSIGIDSDCSWANRCLNSATVFGRSRTRPPACVSV